jgi:MFS family permease
MIPARYRTPALILLCGGLVLTLSLGIRHSFGLFLQPMSMHFGWGRETFAFAIALQNLLWGFSQPFTGMIADRYGSGRVVAAGALLYAAGLALMAHAHTGAELALSAGVLIGLGLSGTSFSIIYGVIGRNYPEEKRSLALGLAGAAGSFGQFAMLPYGQQMISSFGWLTALIILAATALLMAPLAAVVAEPDRIQPTRKTSLGTALKEALGHRGFWLLCLGFLVCGFQVVFIATHLPAFVLDRGLPARAGMMALALIGLFNILGTWGCGYLGGRYSKKRLLSGLYLLRGGVIMLFLTLPLSEGSLYVFASAMGLLWLGTVPLTNGIVSQVFGVRYLATLFGIVFLFHQIGSFLGVWLGGWLFDLTGSYNGVWMIAIILSLIAALLNWPIDDRPLARPATAPA